MEHIHNGIVPYGYNFGCADDNTLWINQVNFKDGRGAPGGVFSLTAGDFELRDTADIFGQAVFRRLADGEYILRQVSVQAGYRKCDAQIKVLVQRGAVYINHTRQNSVYIPAEYSGAVKIVVTEAGREKPNQTVTLYRKKSAAASFGRRSTLRREKISEGVTGNHGEVFFRDLAPGDYAAVIKEHDPVINIAVSDTGEVQICGKAVSEYTVEVLGKGLLNVKVNSVYEGNLSGCTVYLKSGTGEKTIHRSNACGLTCFAGLKPGTYTGEVLNALTLTPDGTVFKALVDEDGVVYVNGSAVCLLEINLTPKRLSPQVTYFFVRDNDGVPLEGVPFTVSSHLGSEVLYSDQNGKVLLANLSASIEYEVFPGEYPGYIPPEAFTIRVKNCRWQSDGIALELSAVVYTSAGTLIRRSFVWRDSCNKNNTRTEMEINFYINGVLEQTEVITPDETIQNFKFFNNSLSTDYRFEINNIPRGYKIWATARGFICQLIMVDITKTAVLSANNILINEITMPALYGSDYILCPERFLLPLKVEPEFYQIKAATEAVTRVFLYGF